MKALIRYGYTAKAQTLLNHYTKVSLKVYRKCESVYCLLPSVCRVIENEEGRTRTTTDNPRGQRFSPFF